MSVKRRCKKVIWQKNKATLQHPRALTVCLHVNYFHTINVFITMSLVAFSQLWWWWL